MSFFNVIAKKLLIGLTRLLSGATVLWYESQPDDSCQRVYFANHTSHLDAMVIWSALPKKIRNKTRPVAAADYWNAGLIRRYISNQILNAVLIERENVSLKNTPVTIMVSEMNDTYSLILFPEGSRSLDGTLGDFKGGLYYLCKKRPDLELIPIYLNNMNAILPKGRSLPVPMLSRVIFGPPMWLEMDERKDSFLRRARDAVVRLRHLEESYEENDIKSEE
ncbi:MAG: 1-acyl-sn-glycerol-3-phosphate acyltransferase [Planctomycetaceae bacterium]|jgi:1-acyl-sn-glycerol-3-phosphate acyltransferase|nr:1-acyl-sn-glycerol-3-phosphate acyltransferase [Planctomycetaceae bacterium]